MLGPASHAYLATTCRALLLAQRWLPNATALHQLCGSRPESIIGPAERTPVEDTNEELSIDLDTYQKRDISCARVYPWVDASAPTGDCGPGASFERCFAVQLARMLGDELRMLRQGKGTELSAYEPMSELEDYRSISPPSASAISAWNRTFHGKLPPGWRPSEGWKYVVVFRLHCYLGQPFDDVEMAL